jgi:hypothetical protein
MASTRKVRKDDKGLYLRLSGAVVRPVETGAARHFGLDNPAMRAWAEDNNNVSVRIDGTSAFAEGDRVITAELGGREVFYLRDPRGEKKTEWWFLQREDGNPRH